MDRSKKRPGSFQLTGAILPGSGFSLALLILGDIKQTVRQPLIQLDADYRAVVVLMDLEDYTHVEAGQIQGQACLRNLSFVNVRG